MMKRIFALAPWILGFCILSVLFFWIDFEELNKIFTQIGWIGILVWVILTLLVRLLLAEVTILPLSVFGAKLSRVDAFWIGWVRSFANQILPLSGLVAYAKAVRDRSGVSWSEISALATPQFFITALAIGLFGALGSLVSLDFYGFGLTLFTIYSVLIIASLVLILHTAKIMRLCPVAVRARLMVSAEAFEKISGSPKLILLLILCQIGVILLRVARLWFLFWLAGQHLEWQDALLLGVIAESTLIIQLTPGGVGLREGSILAGAVLLGVDSGVAASVAIIDRLFVVAMTVIFMLPSVYFLSRGPRVTTSEYS